MEEDLLKQYNAAKGVVKAWELDFKSTHNCKPDRQALSEAPIDVRKAYSSVYKLKKALQNPAPCKEGAESISTTKENRADPIQPNSAEKFPIEKDNRDKEVDKVDLNKDDSQKEEVWGKSLNVSVVEEVVPDKAPLSDLYSKLANNLRESCLSSPSIINSYSRLSLNKKKTNKIKPVKVLEESNSNSQKPPSNLCDPNESKNDKTESVSNDVLFDDENPVLTPKFSVLSKKGENLSIINTNLSVSSHSSHFSTLKEKYNNQWVARCMKSVVPDSDVFQEEPNTDTNIEKLVENSPDINKDNFNDKYQSPEKNFDSTPCHPEPLVVESIPDCLNEFTSPPKEDFSDIPFTDMTENAAESEICDDISDQRLSTKRKRAQTFEELEESDQITPLWPPPKKKRVSRIERNSEEEVDRHKLSIKARRLKIDTEEKKYNVRPQRKRVSKISGAVNAVPPIMENVTSEPFEEKTTDELVPEFNEMIEMENDKSISRFGGRRKRLSKEDRMASKIEKGTLNENFVKIDIKKKKFVKGGRGMTGFKYRRMEWKRKQGLKSGTFNRNQSEPSENKSSGSKKNLNCFKCGDFGHWATNCPGKGTEVANFDENHSLPVCFLTLDEAANLAKGIKSDKPKPSSLVYPSQLSQNETLVRAKSLQDDISDFMNMESGDWNDECPDNEENSDDSDCEANDSDEKTNNEDLADYDNAEEYIANSEREEGNIVNDSNMVVDKSSSVKSISVEIQQENSDDADDCSEVSNSYGKVPSKSVDRITIDHLFDKSLTTAPQEVYDTLKMFGYSSFRPGQEQAILRILQGKNTLVVLSTGSGKSLCYQLPAYMYALKYKCLTICVSPLVSLMEDQVTGLPTFLNAVCLHTNLSPTQKEKTLQAIRDGDVHILLVSPEAVVASGAGGVLGTLMKDLPPIGFACIDEAHCVSQWSHNFRPSYLRVCGVLKNQLGVKTILGLTATARYETTLNIADHLGVKDTDEGIIRGSCVPPNLLLSVSRDLNRAESLVQMLQGDRFGKCDSIIIYCTRRDECERISTLLRTHLITTSKIDVKANLKRRRALSLDAEAYHAGLSAFKRKQIQNKFMSGQLRIVVATVAFGMGIDKSDVRAIIHFNMPGNLESYVQEIGRAGRDGLESHCHLFLDHTDGRDLQELKRFTFVNSVDRVTIKKLLDKLFVPCMCYKKRKAALEAGERPSSESCPKHELALSLAQLIETLDIPQENISTLLCYIELFNSQLLQILPSCYSTCTVKCYGGTSQLCSISKSCPPLAIAIARDNERGIHHQRSNEITFPVVQIASDMGWNSGIVKRELKALEWSTMGGKARPTGVKIEFSDLALHFMVKGDLSDDERDDLLESLFDRAMQQETDQLKQLQYTHQTLRAASHATILLCTDQVDQTRCTKLKEAIGRYFAPGSNELEKITLEQERELTTQEEAHVRQDIRSLLGTHTDQTWTARAVTRVFHGIQSPNFPANIWGRVRRIWRAHINIPFKAILKLAQQEVIRFRRL